MGISRAGQFLSLQGLGNHLIPLFRSSDMEVQAQIQQMAYLRLSETSTPSLVWHPHSGNEESSSHH